MSQFETKIVRYIERLLQSKGIYFINVHGSAFSQNGTPDILACMNGQFVGIEVKRPKSSLGINQYRRGLDILYSGGRFIVAYDDFDITKCYTSTLPTYTVTPSDTEFTLHSTLSSYSTTFELVL